MEIIEEIKPKENELISELDFESDNSMDNEVKKGKKFYRTRRK